MLKGVSSSLMQGRRLEIVSCSLRLLWLWLFDVVATVDINSIGSVRWSEFWLKLAEKHCSG